MLCFTIRDKLTRRIVEFTCSESDILYTLLSLTMVLSELAKPGVWKDKLMIASEKLYDDDYKYIYLKAVVEVLSELDEE